MLTRYLVSYVIFKISNLLILPFNLSSLTAMRFFNIFLVCFVLPSITNQLYQRIHVNASKETLLFASALPAFPLLSFFGNLYYTDVLSTTLVLYCYLLALQKHYVASAMVTAHLYSVLTSPRLAPLALSRGKQISSGLHLSRQL
jgi:hypothetical protein